MPQFETIPTPQVKPSNSGGSVLDDLFGYADRALGTYLDYENWDFYRDIVKERSQINPYSGLPEGQVYGPNLPGATGGINSCQIMTIGLIGLGAIMLLKVIK